MFTSFMKQISIGYYYESSPVLITPVSQKNKFFLIMTDWQWMPRAPCGSCPTSGERVLWQINNAWYVMRQRRFMYMPHVYNSQFRGIPMCPDIPPSNLSLQIPFCQNQDKMGKSQCRSKYGTWTQYAGYIC